MIRSPRATAHDAADLVVAVERTLSLATFIHEAHQLGVITHDHVELWTEAGQRRVIPVFAEVLPDWYLDELGDWFGRSANHMLRRGAPPDLVEEWSLVERTLRSTASVIGEIVERPTSRHDRLDVRRSQPPAIVDYRRIAELVTTDTAQMLLAASDRILTWMESSARTPFDDAEQQILDQMVCGRSITEVAHAIGYSRRTAYRIVAKMQSRVGAGSRDELVAQAIRRGWVDPLAIGA